MSWKLWTVLGGVVAALAVSASTALAGEAEGGHCEYGDFSINIMPSCDTANGGGIRRPLLDDIIHLR